MKQSFKFRHEDEIAGTFVIIAAILFVVAIVMAGRSQGWFDGSFRLKVVFDTVDGSYGLQEGAVVQVRNTVAGRVGKITPTEDGVMGTTLILKERFRPFITKNSVAKIKKKWGLAGDAYVEIERGKVSAPEIEDGDAIKCVKDEELMDSAQRMLNELQSSLQPLLEDVQKIVDNAAGITGSIESGEGLAGAVIKDGEMRDDLKQIVAHLEKVSADIEESSGQVTALLSNNVATVNSIVGDVAAMTHQSREMLTNQVPEIMGRVPGLQDEVLSTVHETRRLIEGMQKMWLFRKYIKQDSEIVPLIPSVFCAASGNSKLQKTLEKSLQQDRLSDNTAATARDAYNLAVVKLAQGDVNGAEDLNCEARLACRTSGETAASTYLLQAEIARLKRDYQHALGLVRQAQRLITSKDQETQLEARLMLAAVYLDAGDVAGSYAEVKRAERSFKKINLPQYGAAIAGLRAGIALRQKKQQAAAEWFAKEAEWLRKAGDYGGLVTALRQAAEVYSNLDMQASAAEFYYRAASAVSAAGDRERAQELLQLAEKAATAACDQLMLKRIRSMREDGTPTAR